VNESGRRAYIGLGANLGDRIETIERAISALGELGIVRKTSSIYRAQPWGKRDQPWFANAAALLETQLEPADLLHGLQSLEKRLGRVPASRWGPRAIDLDLLLYDDRKIDEPKLTVPHPYLYERAFVLVPLAEIDERFNDARDALPKAERESVELYPLARSAALARQNVANMPPTLRHVGERVRALARFLADTDATRVRIERPGEDIEITLSVRHPDRAQHAATVSAPQAAPPKVDTIKADLVGIFHLSRPAPAEGERFDLDRELGYIEALGIRTPVHSMGGGHLVAIATPDGAAVEYGQPLFLVARGQERL
jgi:2-amino-4-hydroxy-6-hydroxymethyldihydropteridine diphosphokinase